jgi:dienelactone hydrolase
MFRIRAFIASSIFLGLGCFIGASASADEDALPQTVHFKSADQQELIGYLFLPAGAKGRTPAIVLMHGRAGPYSSLAGGQYDASTLSKRHKYWGHFWAAHGDAALLVDSFSTRGYSRGFPAHSYGDRPDAVNEVTVRPLDAYGALAYLRSRSDIEPARIALQGWSNGASATLATMAASTLQRVGLTPEKGFAGAVAFYPACGLHGQFDRGYQPYAAVRVFSGDDDEEVSAAHCKKLTDASRAAGGDIAIVVYPGATHDFDDPGAKRQSVEANVAAKADAVARAAAFIAGLFDRGRAVGK